MTFYLVSIILLLCFLFSIRFLAVDLSIPDKLVFYFLWASFYLITTFEIAGLISQLNKPVVIIAIQTSVSALSLFVFRKKLIPFRIHFESLSIQSLRSIIRKYPLVVFFILVIGIIYTFLFYISIHFPQNTSDSLYNHLSRIGYWLQQGSFKIYPSFNVIGSEYPLNNSLLMLWSVAFLRSDILVGTIQFAATIVTSFIIYSLTVRLGFSKISGILAALVFLTFPIVLFESITAQNDLLATCYIGAAFLFLLTDDFSKYRKNLLFSALAMALAIGTKQYALFAFPGYAALAVFMILKHKNHQGNLLALWSSLLIGFTILVGSFSYIRNFVVYQNPVGITQDINYEEILSPKTNLVEKVTINSLRLFSQFVSCDGFPESINSKCIEYKAAAFRAVFSQSSLNLESSKYLLSTDTPFNLSTNYPLNEESSWFGFLGWALVIPGFFYGLYYSIRRKKYEGIILILTAVFYFLVISSFKNGWDSYLGRYLIIAIVLLMPFTSFIMNYRRLINRILVLFVVLISIFVSFYSIINDYSRPLIGKRDLNRLYENSPRIIKKIAVKALPYVVNDKSLWDESRIFQRVYGNQSYLVPVELVNKDVPQGSSLGIVAEEGYFLDYYFFGDDFSRKIYPIKNGQTNSQPDFKNLRYLLISPDFPDFAPPGYTLIDSQNGWRILMK